MAFRVGQCTSPSTKGKKGVGRGRRVRDGGGGEGGGREGWRDRIGNNHGDGMLEHL